MDLFHHQSKRDKELEDLQEIEGTLKEIATELKPHPVAKSATLDLIAIR